MEPSSHLEWPLRNRKSSGLSFHAARNNRFRVNSAMRNYSNGFEVGPDLRLSSLGCLGDRMKLPANGFQPWNPLAAVQWRDSRSTSGLVIVFVIVPQLRMNTVRMMGGGWIDERLVMVMYGWVMSYREWMEGWRWMDGQTDGPGMEMNGWWMEMNEWWMEMNGWMNGKTDGSTISVDDC